MPSYRGSPSHHAFRTPEVFRKPTAPPNSIRANLEAPPPFLEQTRALHLPLSDRFLLALSRELGNKPRDYLKGTHMGWLFPGSFRFSFPAYRTIKSCMYIYIYIYIYIHIWGQHPVSRVFFLTLRTTSKDPRDVDARSMDARMGPPTSSSGRPRSCRRRTSCGTGT